MSNWPLSSLRDVDSCPCCRSGQRRRIYRELIDCTFFCAPGRWDYYECLDCGSLYLDPVPTPNSLYIAYQNYYTHSCSNSEKKSTSNIFRKFVSALANGYRNKAFGTSFEPYTRAGPLIIQLIPFIKSRLDREFRYLPNRVPGSKLLDLGCGSGDFLVLAKQAGWVVSGLDPDPSAVSMAQARGLDVLQSGIESIKDQKETFDMISMSHVIEHLHEPTRVLRECYALLKKGGLLFLETPNVCSFGHSEYGCHWRGLETPRHLVIFNWRSILSALADTGFVNVKTYPSFRGYPYIAKTSRAISKGRDPNGETESKISDYLKTVWFSLSQVSNTPRTEFITLTAEK